ncbi:hypothetical protein GJ496_001931 [Pomphorhynchus laevis]|nr:hypothetical protein GJ496_001931 [Pomphorhynchus laevis]
MATNDGNRNDLLRIWLEQSKHVIVKWDWLQQCVEWVYCEYGNDISLNDMKQKIYEQWLHNDLKCVYDIDAGCCSSSTAIKELHRYLQSSITTNQRKSFHFDGLIIVQVECFDNISKSKYTQIEKNISGQLSITDDQGNEQKQWTDESRLLSLILTDGIQTFKAIEFEPIPKLTNELCIGSKLELSGKIKCHLGIVLLKNHNVTVLGGGYNIRDSESIRLNRILDVLEHNCIDTDKHNALVLKTRLKKASKIESTAESVDLLSTFLKFVAKIPVQTSCSNICVFKSFKEAFLRSKKINRSAVSRTLTCFINPCDIAKNSI